VHWTWAAWAATGVILSACLPIVSYQRVFFGDVTHQKKPRTAGRGHAREVDPGDDGGRDAVDGHRLALFTRRFAVPCQTVLEQMNRSFAQEAALPSASPDPAKAGSSGRILASTATQTSSERSGTAK